MPFSRFRHPEQDRAPAQKDRGLQATGARTGRMATPAANCPSAWSDWSAMASSCRSMSDATPFRKRRQAGKKTVVGRLTMHRDGFGFVIPDAGSLDPSESATRRRYFHSAARDRFGHARRPRAGRNRQRPSRRPRRRPHRPSRASRHTHRGRHLSLRQPPQLRHAHRPENLAGNRDPARNGSSGIPCDLRAPSGERF